MSFPSPGAGAAQAGTSRLLLLLPLKLPRRLCLFFFPPLRNTRRHEIPPITSSRSPPAEEEATRTADERSTAVPSLERSMASTSTAPLPFFPFSTAAKNGHLPPVATTSSDPGTFGAPLGGGSTGGTRRTAPRCLRAEKRVTSLPDSEAAAARAAPAASAQATAAIGSSFCSSLSPSLPRREDEGSSATARGIVGLVEPG